MYIGSVIKAFRIAAGMTQQQLIGDLRTSKQLSRIENNSSLPSYELLHFLSQRLNVSLYDYMPYTDDPQILELKRELDALKASYQRRQYSQVIRNITDSDLADTTKSRTAQLEFVWLQQASFYQLRRLEDIDRELLYQSLDLSVDFASLMTVFKRPLLSVEHHIILIIIALLDDRDHTLKIAAYRAGVEYFEKFGLYVNTHLCLKYCFNLSNLLMAVQREQAAIDYAEQGIANCIKNSTYYYLSGFYQIASRAHQRLNNAELSDSYLCKALATHQLINMAGNAFPVGLQCLSDQERMFLTGDDYRQLYAPNEIYNKKQLNTTVV